MRKPIFSTTLAAALVAAAPAWGVIPQYSGTAAVMVIDPITENWTCGQGPSGAFSLVPAERCYAGDVQGGGVSDGAPVAGTTYGLNGIAHHGGIVSWVVGGGAPGYDGPGSNISKGDNFMIFQSADNHDGRRGVGMVLMNDNPRPDDGGFWGLGSFHYSSSTGSYLMVANANYPTGNANTITDTTIWLGESFNGYTYSWRDLVTFEQTPTQHGGPADYGVRVVGVSAIPDPSNALQWIGVWSWTELDGPGGWGGDGGRGSGPAKIDFSQAGTPGIGVQLCLGFENLDSSPPPGDRYDFHCYHEGEVVNQRPQDPLTGLPARPARIIPSFAGVAQVTTTTGGTHAELWWQVEGTQQGPLWCDSASNRALLGYAAGPNPVFGGNYTAQENCSLERNFCGPFLTDPALYLNNRDNLSGGTPNFLRYRELDLGTLWVTGPNKHLDNQLTGLNGSMRGWPSVNGDHARTYSGGAPFDWNEPGKLGLYVNVKRSHCLEPYNWGNQKFQGHGFAYVNLVEE